MSQVVARATEVVGRAKELAELEDLLARARIGSGGVVLVAGEAGIGKTRLVNVLVERARELGFGVGVGRAWDGRGAPALFVWSAAFAAAGHPLEIPRALVGEADAFTAIERVASHARELACARPLVLVLDDLHWADLPSLLALRLVARGPTPQLVVAATVRVPEVVAPELSAVLDDVRHEATAVLELTGLTEHEIADLAATWGADASLTTALHRASGGNPFFAMELFHDEVARGALAGGRELVVPRGARALLSGRFARLGELAEVIACAALGPQPKLDRDLVARATCCAPDRVETALETAIDLGLAIRSTDGSVRFAHDLVRAGAVEGLTPPRRRDLHLGWAQALDTDADPQLAIAGAFHAIAADPITDDEAVRDRAFAAGRLTMTRMSYAEAAALCDFAAAADERAGRSGGAAHALAQLAEVLTLQGETERATTAAQRAVALARHASDPHAFAAAALALALKRRLGVTDQAVIDLLDEALRGLEGLPAADADDAAFCAVQARLASALQPFVDPPRALRLARDAIARARVGGDERILARTLHAARPAFRILDDLDERLSMDSELLYLATKHADDSLAAQARGRLCILSIERGDALALDAHLAAYQALADRLQSSQHELGVTSCRAMRATIRGDVETARSLIAEVEASRSRWSDAAVVPNIDPVVLLRVGLALVTQDEVSYSAFSAAPSPPLTRAVIGLFAALRVGRMKEAADLYAGVADRLLSPESANFVFRAILADAAFVLGDAGRGAVLYELLAPYAGRHVIWTPFPIYDGSIDRLRARLALLLGRDDIAAIHFDDAVAAEEAFGAKPFADRTRRERQQSLPDRSSDHAIKARAQKVKELWGLTGRQLDVVMLLANGDSNKTIAEKLGCAERTVEVHITAVLRKAGVVSRAELIARFWRPQ